MAMESAPLAMKSTFWQCTKPIDWIFAILYGLGRALPKSSKISPLAMKFLSKKIKKKKETYYVSDWEIVGGRFRVLVNLWKALAVKLLVTCGKPFTVFQA